MVVDDLSSGHREDVRGADLVVADIADAAAIDALLSGRRIEGIVHLAASCQVGESVQHPEDYYRNNLTKSLVLLERACRSGVGRFVFSSTAAVYGEPERLPLQEDHATRPTNPYGETKREVERMLQGLPLRSVSLRYFNAAGAHPDATLGERHDPETHLIPLVLQVAAGQRAHLARFGTDHPTADGSCVRDYVHVQDLCEAHLLALKRLEAGGASAVYNLGSGTGHSVTEVIEAARRVTGHPIPVHDAPARARAGPGARRGGMSFCWFCAGGGGSEQQQSQGDGSPLHQRACAAARRGRSAAAPHI